jgi:signal transduction histidine kinase
VLVGVSVGLSGGINELLGDTAVDLAGPTAGLAASIAAWSAFRARRDPSAAFAAIAAAAIALGGFAAVVAWSWLLGETASPGLATESSEGGFIPISQAMFDRVIAGVTIWPSLAWLAACVSLAFATPWRDRRGRPPLRAWIPAVTILGGLVLIGIAGVELASPYPQGLTTVIGVLTALGGTVAYARGTWAGYDRHLLRWAAAASLSSVIAALAWASYIDGHVDRSDLRALPPAMTVMGSIFLLVGVMASNRQDASRMRRATDRATEVMEGRAEIAATIAHDVRGPVGTIKGLATTTRKSYDRLGDPERLEFIGMIEQESGRLLRLVDQVAMGLKIDAGSLDLHRRVQDIGPMLVHARAQIETDRTVTIEVPDGLEAPIDTRWYSEAVAQGIDNALRFSPSEGSVEVRAQLIGSEVAVEIIDQGPGIPPDQREALFEKFSRWRPVGYDDRTGTGLGLFICRGIARAHGGDATLDDAPGGGTMLRILVPAEERST